MIEGGDLFLVKALGQSHHRGIDNTQAEVGVGGLELPRPVEVGSVGCCTR